MKTNFRLVLCVVIAMATIFAIGPGRPELAATGPAGHLPDIVAAVAFSPDGRTLASADWQNNLKLWDVATGQQIGTLVGNTKPVVSLMFSPDGHTLASGSL